MSEKLGVNQHSPSEKTMAPHSSTLAWKIPWVEEPGRLQSRGSLRVRHDWASSLSLSCIWEGNGNPLQCSCLENPGGLLSLELHRVGHDWSNLAVAAAAILYLPLMWSSLPNSFTVTPPLGEESLVASLSPNPITLIHFTQSWLWQLPTLQVETFISFSSVQ